MEECFRQCSIEEASIMFSSNNYTQLKCKIIDGLAGHVISSSFISNCIECYIPICRKITDFYIELWDCKSNIAKFEFEEGDMECNPDDLIMSCKEKTIFTRFGSDHIRLKKQTDQCCLYFKVYEEDLEKEGNPLFCTSDFHLRVVQDFYQKMVVKAMKRLKKFSQLKRSQKRFTISEKREVAESKTKQNFSHSLGFRHMRLSKRSCLQNLDQNKALKRQLLLASSQKKSNFDQQYDCLKKSLKKQRMRTIGMEELVSEKIRVTLAPKGFDTQRDEKIISLNGFMMGRNQYFCERFKKKKRITDFRRDIKQQEKGQKQKKGKHRRYVSQI